MESEGRKEVDDISGEEGLKLLKKIKRRNIFLVSLGCGLVSGKGGDKSVMVNAFGNYFLQA